MANLAVVASSGAIVLDAMAILLIGYATISVRTGKNHPPIQGGLTPWGQLLHMEWAGLKAVKLGGVLMVLSTALMLLPFSWQMLAKILLGVLAIELIALLILECAFRHRTLGNLAMLISLILAAWSIHLCSSAIARYLIKAEIPSRWNTSWTTAIERWPYMVLILIGTMTALLALLKWRRKRDERLTRPRLWLFN